MPKKETPAQSSGRHTSTPFAPGEEEAARQRIRDEVAKGKPYVILNLDSLVLEVMAVSIKEDGSVGLTISAEGEVVRGTKKAVVRCVENIAIPATIMEEAVDAT